MMLAMMRRTCLASVGLPVSRSIFRGNQTRSANMKPTNSTISTLPDRILPACPAVDRIQPVRLILLIVVTTESCTFGPIHSVRLGIAACACSA